MWVWFCFRCEFGPDSVNKGAQDPFKMGTAAAQEVCELSPLSAGHTLLSCQLDGGKPTSNSHKCEPSRSQTFKYGFCEWSSWEKRGRTQLMKSCDSPLVLLTPMAPEAYRGLEGHINQRISIKSQGITSDTFYSAQVMSLVPTCFILAALML